MKQKLYILALLLTNLLPAVACFTVGDSPRNYMYYRVSDSNAIPYFAQPNYKYTNLKCWQEQAYNNRNQYGGADINLVLPLSDIEKVVYQYSIEDMQRLIDEDELPKNDQSNAFAVWCMQCPIYAKLLLIAKQIEYTRIQLQDPWYYPASSNEHFAPLEQLLVDMENEDKFYTLDSDDSRFYLHRYLLQRIRILFSLGRYNECINLWENNISNWNSDDLMRTMIKDYIAGAYVHTDNIAQAQKMYFEQGNYWALADLTHTKEGGYVGLIRAVYDYEPNCANLIAPALQYDLEELGQYWFEEERSKEKAQKYYDLMQYIIRTHRSRDMAIWYYTAAYLEDFLGMPKRAAQTIHCANQCKTSDFMRDNIRYMCIYLDAKTCQYNAAYEQQLFADLRWIDEQIKQNLPNIKAKWDEYSKWEIWDNRSHPVYGMKDKGYNLYYPNTMLRKIVLGEVAPRMKQAGKQSLSLALTNYADNLLFTLVEPDTRHCFFNNFFMAMDTIPAAAVEQYAKRALNPTTPFERFLATGSYLDKDYLYDIVGTLYLRESQYKKAMEVLSQVSPTYQLRLNTHDNLCAHDPFGVASNSQPTNTVDCKYNFASEMYALQQVFQNSQIDPNRRANAMLSYAIGYKNSFLTAWGLTQYGRGYPVHVDAYKPWMTEQREKAIKQQYKKLYDEAFSLYTDDEALAAAHLRYQNNYTIVTNFPNTAAAHFVRSHCDTYYDYHPENR